MHFRADWDRVGLRRARGRAVVSAKIIPWRPRQAPPAPKLAIYLPALIDGHVSVYALIDGLASVGLALRHDPVNGTFLIVPQQEPGEPGAPDESQP